MNLLVARGLVVEARTGSAAVAVLRGLNLSIAPGQALGFVGESGAGASLLGRAIASLLPSGTAISHGTLEFEGTDLVSMPEAERRSLLGHEIAFLPSDPQSALNPAQPIETQLDAHHRRLGVRGRRALRDRAEEALATAGLAEPDAILAARPHELSPEVCQRVHLAMAFAGRPKLLVAEDPTAALDMPGQARLIELLHTMRAARGAAMLFITGDLRLAAAVCTDIAVLYAGDVVEAGPAPLLLRAPRHPYTKCLSLALPPLTGPRNALYVLPELMPGLRSLARLTGCRFAPRCPVQAEYCLRSEPPLEGDTHRSACLRPGLVQTIMAPGPIVPPPWRPAGEQPVLVLDGLAKSYAALPRRAGATPALHGMSLRVAPGEFVAVVGARGSGKSTLARIVAGIEEPDDGQIILDGMDVTADSQDARKHRAATVQMVFADPRAAVNPRFRISDIVTQSLLARKDRSRLRERRARALLAEMGMALEVGVRTAAQLSDGQLLRVGIARALCAAPRLLVADAILDGLDATVRAQLLTLLHRLRQEHDFALLITCRDLSVARHLCDRVVVMHQGTIVEEGLAETVLGWPRHAETAALVAAEPR